MQKSFHLAALEALGFMEVEAPSNLELLDNDTLLKMAGMLKPEVKMLRECIEAQGAGPTLVSRWAAASYLGTKN